MRRAKRPPPIDRLRLTHDTHVRMRVATVIEDHLRAVSPGGSGDTLEATFATAVLQMAELVAPMQERRW